MNDNWPDRLFEFLTNGIDEPVAIPAEHEQEIQILSQRIGELQEKIHGTQEGETMNNDWQPPPWLLCHWIAMDEDGAWRGFLAEPSIGQRRWHGSFGGYLELSESFLDFDPPPCDDWKTSKRRLREASQ